MPEKPVAVGGSVILDTDAPQLSELRHITVRIVWGIASDEIKQFVDKDTSAGITRHRM